MQGRLPKHVVTGACGFIGSTTAERLLTEGKSVVGIDSMNDHYDPRIKAMNLALLERHANFRFVRGDLRSVALRRLLDEGDIVYHLAALSGVRDSWASRFGAYLEANVEATQALLEACVASGVARVVYASSSSVYGNAAAYPVSEAASTRPHSPYGVTKLAGEQLCSLYGANRGLSTVSLRYFTVYGPRQRPDMAIYRIIQAGLNGTTFRVFGDGTQRRDFTFVGDVVRANIAAGSADVAPGTVVNVAGGTDISLTDLISEVGRAIGRPVSIEFGAPSAGDVARTGGTIDRIIDRLGWQPMTSIEQGIQTQVAWHRCRTIGVDGQRAGVQRSAAPFANEHGATAVRTAS